ncbi:MAG: ABC transporter permease, partial [Clostridia bacterium]|nr:ABC transporter permease [Clostridia bacterium]
IYYGIAMAICCGLWGMTVFSSERQQNTLRLLYAMPLSSFSIFTGKLLARLVIVIISCALFSIIPIVFSLVTPSAYIMEGLGCVAALCALGIMFMSLSVFCASVTPSSIVSLILYIVLVGASYLMPQISGHIGSLSRLTFPFVVLLPVIAGLVIYMLFSDVLIGFIAAAAALVPVLYAYLTSNGQRVFTALGNGLANLDIFSPLTPFSQSVFDVGVLLRYLLIGLFFCLCGGFAVAAQRKAKGRLPL